MKLVILAILVTIAGCQSGPPPLPKPAKDAPVWDLNPGRWPGTNDLMHEPSVTSREPTVTPGVN